MTTKTTLEKVAADKKVGLTLEELEEFVDALRVTHGERGPLEAVVSVTGKLRGLKVTVEVTA